MLNRDNLIISLTAFAALLTFLLSSPPVNTWSYYDWLKALSLGLAWVSGNVVPRLGVTMTGRAQRARERARTHVTPKDRR